MRASELRARPLDSRTSPVAGLSFRGLQAIAYLERSRFTEGAVARALRAWANFVQDPWHRLWDPRCGCGVMECCPDLGEVRQILEAAGHVLPARDARRFRVEVAKIDELW
ncbi:hypothetical protein GCM10022225_31670 [Plantactinospora mayteni]|uniref:Uncharacterized protein n=1 Tax=Plantactinospora mayteni TaxID=566021 RepID=A0ABQ4ELP9_9ACTN|nr:hypothetical protein Pma05_22420 [Plantactinospora mayteni]